MIKCFILGYRNNGLKININTIMLDTATTNSRGYGADITLNYSDTSASFNATVEAGIIDACINFDGIPTPDAFIWMFDPTISTGTSKRVETYSGTSNGSGNYTVTFATAFAVAPNIQANIVNGSNTQIMKITSVSTTGFTVNVTNRTDVLGLLPSYSNVSAASVDVVVTEK